MFVDGKCVCGGQNEILYEYVPGDEPIADNSGPNTAEPQPNICVIGNYGSPEFSSDVQTSSNLFNVNYKSVCRNRVHSSPPNNTSILDNRTGNELPDRVSGLDLTKENNTTCVNDQQNTTYTNVENSSDKCTLNKTSQMESNGLAVCITTSKIESDSLRNISRTTKTSKQSVTETSMTDTQNNYLSTVVEVKKHLASRKENVNNTNRIEKPDKLVLSTTGNDVNRAEKYVFVQTSKQRRFKPMRYTTTFKKHKVLSYTNNGRLLLIIN